MSDEIIINKIKPLLEVKRVYSGKPGCACGCRGKYYPDSENKLTSNSDMKMIKKVYRLFQSYVNQGKVYSWEDTQDKFVKLDIGENRTYTLHYY